MNTRNNITPEQIRKINADTQEIEKFRKVSMQKLQKNDFQSAQMFFSLLSAAAGRCSDTLREIIKDEDVVSTTTTSEQKESCNDETNATVSTDASETTATDATTTQHSGISNGSNESTTSGETTSI